MKNKYILGMSWALILFSCSNPESSNKKTTETFPAKDLIIYNEDEGWGGDIRLSITEIKRTDTSVNYIVNSLYDKNNIGFQISIPEEKNKRQMITFKSVGNISNNFILALAKIYKEQSDTSLHFVNTKQAAFVDLNEFAKKQFGQEPGNKNRKDLKVFFESENPDDYAEFYLNINESEQWIEFREKEDSYRKQVIKGLTVK
jgi:hypothetical protein